MVATTMRERRREQTRAELAQTTLQVVADEGIDAATIERLCEAGGTSRATIYAHFPDGRDGLLRAAYSRAGEVLVERARSEAAEAAGWESRIASYARTMIDFSRSATLGPFYSVSGPHLLGFRAERGVGSQAYFEDIRSALNSAKAAGELPSTADPEALAVQIVSGLRDAGIAAAHRPEDGERFVAALQAILTGLRCAPRRRDKEDS